MTADPTEALIAALAEAIHTHQMAIGDPMRHRCRPGCLRSYFTLLSPEARDAMLLGFDPQMKVDAELGKAMRKAAPDGRIYDATVPLIASAVTAALEALDDDA